ncbi:MAG: hypothetical protein OMM_01528 [Candidatus Magnetoglobus multicellularis str. Araruama]|uniref:Tetratricopeptide repeat protein n=1 Tax=Candidatus Magnetoglobus multicellularis str. Araruama TaxID=890399 RepID=A0A1V1PCP1_9BACT|nr:MAG: hypothetical protein OMM_01528 [Candidatus Magnetoglobus multicellularis str. Araruama]
MAPIDHIRELVASNPNVRTELVKLQNGDTNISDEVKRKLYLYGIIHSDFNNNNIIIKNPIVKKSLSINWIKSVELQSKSLFDIALQYITTGANYLEGVSLLNEYLDNNLDIGNAEKELSYYYIGFAHHQLREYEKSNKYFKKMIISQDTSLSMHYRQKCFIGLNHFSLNEFDEGKALLEDVINNYKKEQPYAIALLNLAIQLIEKGSESNRKKQFHYWMN